MGAFGTAAALFDWAVDKAVESERRRTSGVLGQPPQWEPLSPWATQGNLNRVDWMPDAFGARTSGPVSPDQAMRVAPLKKGRAILHALIASRPLVEIVTDSNGIDTTLRGSSASTWLYRTDTSISPQLRHALTLDDHIFFEASVWAVLRGATPAGQLRGPILDAVHLPYEWWKVNDAGFLEVQDAEGAYFPVDPDAVLYIPGPSRGLTVEAQNEIRQWQTSAENTNRRLSTPTPSLVLTDPNYDSSGSPELDEVQEMVSAIAAARRSPDGAVMYAANLQAVALQSNDDAQLYIGFRNALRIDLANHLNLPVSLLDGSPATASLTYSTKEGGRDELADLSLPYWTTPIERALSQDNVVARGHRIRFDFTDLYAAQNAPTGAAVPD